MKIPQEVKDWVTDHKGWRKPHHAEGSYQEYRDSKLSMCWGNNGLETKNYHIAVCQPSPFEPNGIGFFYYDFKKKIDAGD